MGRIISSVTIASVFNPENTFRCDALVDTGAAYMTLPSAWKDRLGELERIATVSVETATQELVEGEIYGPVRIEIEGFRPIFDEVLFVDMKPEDGVYEPLIGYLVLERSQAGVDMLGHRLVKIKHVDLKSVSALSDWDRPEEDEVWSYLQRG